MPPFEREQPAGAGDGVEEALGADGRVIDPETDDLGADEGVVR